MGSFNRDGVKRRLVEVLTHALGEQWDVSYEWPGDTAGDRWLYFDAATSGDATVDTLKGAPGSKRLASDSFQFQGLLCVQGLDSAEEAERLAADGLRTVDDTLRRLTRLRDDTAVIPDGDTDAYAGIQSVHISRVEGPAATAPQVDDVLIDGMCLLTITCTSQL